jgi:integrase
LARQYRAGDRRARRAKGSYLVKIAKPRDGEPIRLVTTSAGQPRYRVRIDAGLDPETGKRVQVRSTHDTLSAARAAVSAHRSDRDRGVLVSLDRRNRSTFKDFAEAWIAARETSGKIRANTAIGYRQNVSKANEFFGAKAVADVTDADVEALISAGVKAGRTKRTASLRLFVLRAIFKDAIRQKIVARNPAEFVEARGAESKRREGLTGEQLARLRASLTGDRLYAVWLLVLLGLRRSEVLGLTWADLDLQAETLMIERSRALVTGDVTTVGPTKTLRGRRVLPLPKDVLCALGDLRDSARRTHGAKHAATGNVVVDEVGQPLRHERLSDMWTEHCTAIGLPGVTLHAARHSSVTAMREAGVADFIVAAWHGHDEVVMKRTYTTAHPKAMAEAGSALSQRLFRA